MEAICSEYGCRQTATQTIQSGLTLKNFCDNHYRSKVQIIQPNRLPKNTEQCKIIHGLKQLLQETSRKIILESSLSIKAIQIKTQNDLQSIRDFKKSIQKLVVADMTSLNIHSKFLNLMTQEPFFVNHFQELGKQIQVYEEELKTSKTTQMRSEKPRNYSTKIKIPRGKDYNEPNVIPSQPVSKPQTDMMPVEISPQTSMKKPRWRKKESGSNMPNERGTKTNEIYSKGWRN